MKKILKSILAALMISALVFNCSSYKSIAADTGTGVIEVEKNRVMKLAKSGISRTTSYSYVVVKANSVYPLSSSVDTFTKCRTRIYNSGTAISATTTLTEGTSENVSIYEGSLNKKTFSLYFSGNDPDYKAGISYYYNGK